MGGGLMAIGDLPEHPHIDPRIERPHPLVSDYMPRLQPLLVTGLGRSGTTWLMRLLMQDERIVIGREQEHEVEGARHWMNMLLAYFEGRWWEGKHPLETGVGDEVKDWVRTVYPRLLAGFCQKSIDEFYMLLARSQGQSTPLLFAEKSPGDETAALMAELYSRGKEVFLVRDFRDAYCSIVAFSRNTGSRAFRWRSGWSEETYLRERGKNAEAMRAAWLARRERSLLVRYEDLIREPLNTLERLWDYLGIGPPAGGVEGVLAAARRIDYADHRTSVSDEASIGRWRRELDPALQSVANDAFAGALRDFGYQPGPPSRREGMPGVVLRSVASRMWARLLRSGGAPMSIGDLPEHAHIDPGIERPRPLGSDYSPKLQPLLVTGIGRSGTTWLMRLLMQDERIVLHRYYTHEIRGARHWMTMLLSYFRGAWWEGQHPFETGIGDEIKHWIRFEYARTLAAFCQQRIDDFYLLLAQSQGQTSPIFFAEKSLANEHTEMLGELYLEGKEIFIVRDFRDMFCSVVSRNRQRGYRSLGWRSGWSEETFMRERGEHVENIRRAWLSRRERSLLVRYEDLVKAPTETLERILGYLGLSRPAGGVKSMVDAALGIDFESHRTTDNAQESIGRWRRELSPELQALANDVFAPALDEFGYERD